MSLFVVVDDVADKVDAAEAKAVRLHPHNRNIYGVPDASGLMVVRAISEAAAVKAHRTWRRRKTPATRDQLLTADGKAVPA